MCAGAAPFVFIAAFTSSSTRKQIHQVRNCISSKHQLHRYICCVGWIITIINCTSIVSPFSACVMENFTETIDIGIRSVRSPISHILYMESLSPKHKAQQRIYFANMTSSSRTSWVTKKFGGRESSTQRQTLIKET